MATAKKKTTKKRRTTRAPQRARSTTRRKRTTTRRKKKALSSGGGGNSRVTWAKALSVSGGGAVGGALYTAPQFFVKLPWWGKGLYAIAASVTAAKFKAPSIGAGMSGAFVQDMAKTLFSTSLKDLDNANYVDASTLSDSGYLDEDGNQVLCDNDGTMFALADDGEYVPVGNMADMDIQTTSMLPLQDAYSLQDPYSLQDAYSLAQASNY